MKNQILGLLAFPRALLRDDIEFDDCPHSGNFAIEDAGCQECGAGVECAWLYSNEEYAALEDRSLEELIDSLDFARAYVEFRVDRWGHNRRTCSCEACRWVRNAGRVLQSTLDRE
jgi:hypothetical protein